MQFIGHQKRFTLSGRLRRREEGEHGRRDFGASGGVLEQLTSTSVITERTKMVRLRGKVRRDVGANNQAVG